MEEIFNGYVESDVGITALIIYKNADAFLIYDAASGAQIPISNPDDLFSEYGTLRLYRTLEDFKRGNSIGAERVMV